MKKVKLSLDGLRVDSFPTAEIGRETGTVHARQISPAWASCGDSCRFSCDDSCNESCTCPIESVCLEC